MDHHSDIAEFLTTRRAKITPEQAGLPTYGQRRVTGLRREEVASLAGVSVEYYKRLERGNVSGVSELVLEGLARALQLDDAERAHLFDLVRAAGRPGFASRSGPGPSSSGSARSCSASSTRSPRRPPCATPAWTTSAPTRSGARSTRRCSTAASSPPTAPASRSSIPPPRTSTPSGSASRQSSSPTCAPRPAATPTTASCPTSSASCRRAATSSASAGRRTTCASTAPAPSSIHHPVVGELDLSYETMELSADDGLSVGDLHRRARLGIAAGARPARQLDGDAADHRRRRRA